MTRPLDLPLAPEDRRLTIGSTDIRYIANGEVEQLWRQKRGLIEPPNLDHVYRVQLGKFTEPFHAGWHLKTIRESEKGWGMVKIEGQRLPLPERKLPAFVAASYDYWLFKGLLSHPADPNDVVLELKHTNERNSHRQCATYYMAQLQWQMLVSDERRMRFSMAPGNSDPVWGEVEADLVLQELLLEKAEAFMQAVDANIPLHDTAPDQAIAEAAKAVKIDGKRAYDWSKNNEWCALEEQFILGRAMQKQGKEWEHKLKKLVPADANEVTGRDVNCKRTKAGALRFDIADQLVEEAERRCASFTLRDGPVDIVRG